MCNPAFLPPVTPEKFIIYFSEEFNIDIESSIDIRELCSTEVKVKESRGLNYYFQGQHYCEKLILNAFTGNLVDRNKFSTI